MLAQVPIGNTYNVMLGTQWTLNDVVSVILLAAMSIAGIIFLFMVMGGGIAIMSSGGDPERAGRGQKAATAGFIGFVVIFAAYWIVRIIEIVVGVDFVSNPLI
jgi:hypothetical protein